jgi:hypothetical protein
MMIAAFGSSVGGKEGGRMPILDEVTIREGTEMQYRGETGLKVMTVMQSSSPSADQRSTILVRALRGTPRTFRDGFFLENDAFKAFKPHTQRRP